MCATLLCFMLLVICFLIYSCRSYKALCNFCLTKCCVNSNKKFFLFTQHFCKTGHTILLLVQFSFERMENTVIQNIELKPSVTPFIDPLKLTNIRILISTHGFRNKNTKASSSVFEVKIAERNSVRNVSQKMRTVRNLLSLL